MTDKLAQQREVLVGALNDARPSPDWAWEMLNTWDSLVEIAMAAQDMVDYAAPIPLSELVRRKDALAAAVARLQKENE